MKKFRIGIIGPGAFGQFCIKNYQKMPEVDVVAIAGKSAKHDKQVADDLGIARWSDDYRDLLRDSSIDAVAIFTPPYLHAQMAIGAAKAGKPFLCEKPLALTAEDGQEIIETTKRNNVPATINYVMRYAEIYEEIKIIVRENRFGKLERLIFENYAQGDYLGPDHWLWDEAKSGGLLVEHGVHFFDIFNQIINKRPETASSFLPQANEAFAAVRYPNNALATFYHLFDKTKDLERNYARFIFERGYAKVKGWIPMELELGWQDNTGTIQTKKQAINLSKDEYYGQLVQEVMRDLLKRIDNPEYKAKVTLEDGLASLEIALMAKKRSMF